MLPYLVADTKELSRTRNTSRCSCHATLVLVSLVSLDLSLAPTMVLLLLETTEPSQGASGKHSESHEKDANGPLRSPADRPALATSRKKPLRTRFARNHVGKSSAWVRWG